MLWHKVGHKEWKETERCRERARVGEYERKRKWELDREKTT